MARLYYPPTEVARGHSGEEKKSSTTKETIEKVALLIPAEIIGAYLAILGFIPLIKNIEWHQSFYYGSFILCLVATFFYMKWQGDKRKNNSLQIFISTTSFPFWAYAISGERVIPNYYDAAIASIALIVFSLIVSLIPPTYFK